MIKKRFAFLPSFFVGILSLVLYTLNLAFWVTVLFVTAFMWVSCPLKTWRIRFYRCMQSLPSYWIDGHDVILKLTTHIDWQIEGLENLYSHQWYFLVANHQSWADILVLEKVFNRKIPTLKFFLKKALIWLPFAGQACWLLDFPFMQRPNKKMLKKNPQMKGKDMTATRSACEKFKQHPTTIINFLEGTRFSLTKHQAQHSPYRYLLKPKSAGLAAALSVLGGCVTSFIDVTIVYPNAPVRAWDFFCGRMKKIVVKVRVLPLPSEFLHDFSNNRVLRGKFQQWINQLWQEKDDFIHRVNS